MNTSAARTAHAGSPPEQPSAWQVIVDMLAVEFNAKVCMFWHCFEPGHDYGGHAETAGFSEEARAVGVRLAGKSPWLLVMRRRDVGTFIDGGQLLGEDFPTSNRAAASEFCRDWMLPYGAMRGLGAVLFKDRDNYRHWLVGIAVLRPDGEPGVGVFSPEEKERFRARIPFLLENMATHPFLEALKNRDISGTLRYAPPALPKALMPDTPPDNRQKPEVRPDPSVDTPPEPPLSERISALLMAVGVGEHQRPALSQAFTQLIENSDNPEVVTATLAGLNAIHKAVENRKPAQAWQERVARPQLSEPPPKQKGGRKRKDPPPTEADLKEGNRILWLAREGKEVDPEALKKAERDRKWVQNEKKRRLAWQESAPRTQ